MFTNYNYVNNTPSALAKRDIIYNCRFCLQPCNINHDTYPNHTASHCPSCQTDFANCVSLKHIFCPTDSSIIAPNYITRAPLICEIDPSHIIEKLTFSCLDISSLLGLLKQNVRFDSADYNEYALSLREDNSFFSSFLPKNYQRCKIGTQHSLFRIHQTDSAGNMIGTVPELRIDSLPSYSSGLSIDDTKTTDANLSFLTLLSPRQLEISLNNIIYPESLNSIPLTGTFTEEDYSFIVDLPALIGVDSIGFCTRIPRRDSASRTTLFKSYVKDVRYNEVYQQMKRMLKNSSYPFPLLMFIFCAYDDIDYKSTVIISLLEDIARHCSDIVIADLKQNRDVEQDYRSIVRKCVLYSSSKIAALTLNIESLRDIFESSEAYKMMTAKKYITRSGHIHRLLYEMMLTLISTIYDESTIKILKNSISGTGLSYWTILQATYDIVLQIILHLDDVHSLWYKEDTARSIEEFRQSISNY